MPELQITPSARADLVKIGQYTQTTWGVRQRNDYLGQFSRLFEQLLTGQIKGKNRRDIRENLLDHPCGQHMVFFRRDALNNVQIIRILHQRMDFNRHLEGL